MEWIITENIPSLSELYCEHNSHFVCIQAIEYYYIHTYFLTCNNVHIIMRKDIRKKCIKKIYKIASVLIRARC